MNQPVLLHSLRRAKGQNFILGEFGIMVSSLYLSLPHGAFCYLLKFLANLMSHCRRREYQAFFCKILCRLVTPRHASAHANHYNISLDLLAAASRGTGASRRGQAARRSVRRVQMSLKAATSASRCVLGYRRSDLSSQRMAASGHEDQFLPPKLSAGFSSLSRPMSSLALITSY